MRHRPGSTSTMDGLLMAARPAARAVNRSPGSLMKSRPSSLVKSNLLDLAYVHPPSAVGKTPHPRLARLSPAIRTPSSSVNSRPSLDTALTMPMPWARHKGESARHRGRSPSDRRSAVRPPHRRPEVDRRPRGWCRCRPFPAAPTGCCGSAMGCGGSTPAGFGSLSEAVHGPVGFGPVHGASPYRLESGLAQRVVMQASLSGPRWLRKFVSSRR
ncbi:MAG: hypothetical protein Ct9H300mP12_10130 [Acidimicrobiales bacterium]|nr:MAG: hypothetical protein Ct9H300mP12_10130 [Acidimicrobiales bacterium]